MKNRIKSVFVLALLGCFIAGHVSARQKPTSTRQKPAAAKQPPKQILAAQIGSNDSIMIRRAKDGAVLFSENSDKPLVPASIIKIVTSLAALHYLGEDYRFPTECYQRKDGTLVIKGYGDPSLISEEVDLIAGAVGRMAGKVPAVAVDYSYFTACDLPGRCCNSLEPYDAPIGALCVNYNTVSYKKQKNGTYVSSEPQTPLLPFALDRIRSLPFAQGRVMVINCEKEAAIYTGEMFAYFLGRHGCPVRGPVVEHCVDPETDRLVYQHPSKKNLRQIVAQLLHYSSNFTANQLLFSCGVSKYGPPATLDKGLRALQFYLQQELKIRNIQLTEGSGLSTENRVSAATMCRLLDAFAPYQELMKKAEDEYYKTGTLTNVSTRAGYITADSGRRFQYVIMLNTPGKKAKRLMPVVKQFIQQADSR
jgi:D-alanyl-D-alanine carboxypeptidase/D-alanyl-D-alanine-endopeptidase (penicillin-binding protein 4)